MAEKWKSEEFVACLSFDRICTNNSGSGYYWNDFDAGFKRYINQTTMEQILKTTTIHKGKLKCKWKTYKRGPTVSLLMLENIELDCENCDKKIQCALRGDK